MERTRFLVIGAGVSGLAFAGALDDDDYLVCEADREIGGYCKTIKQDGFVWDYSGHFFHFKHKDIEQELVSKMKGQRVLHVVKDSRILWKQGNEYGYIDFPFQKNIHQLPKDEFIDCLVDLYFREDKPPSNFQEMLYAKLGRSIAEKFLIPYNEKLYATELDALDVDAMGRFFPHANTAEIIRNFRTPDNASYNATFTYPEGGAIQYVHALMESVNPSKVALDEAVIAIDLRRKVARTTRREIAFEHVVSSAPFDRLLAMAGIDVAPGMFSYNKVLVFNLGFDRKGLSGAHWVYVPQRDVCFYRVGFYDNIFGTDRMSLYIEIGRPKDAEIHGEEIERMRDLVLRDLAKVGIVQDHRLVSSHSIVLDPAYVHITKRSNAEVARLRGVLATRGIYTMGRYGAWTYCSIEDNIVEARGLAATFNQVPNG